MSRILGLDVGDARTGLALSDELRITAVPHSVVPTTELAGTLKALTSEHGIRTIVVGRPRHLDGSIGEQAVKIDGIVEQLKLAVPAEYVYEDETGTTAEAASDSDAEAARGMLQGYLDEHAR